MEQSTTLDCAIMKQSTYSEVDPSNESECYCSDTKVMDEKQMTDLQKEVFELRSKLVETENKLSRALLRLENIKDDNLIVTGFLLMPLQHPFDP